MPNIFKLSMSEQCFDNLRKIKNKLQKEIADEEIRRQNEIMNSYIKHHIFNSYEEALDWAIKNPNESINWHCKILSWQEDKQKFESYEQEYSLDGIVCYDVIKYYTKEELLKGIDDFIQHSNEIYPEINGKKWWLDEYGKLRHVSL